MADLTLENIQNMRKQLNGHPDSVASGDTLLQLLDAAERGLSNDRKAAAFDFLSGLRYIDVMNDGWTTMHCDDSVSSDGATLLDCVEMAMREHKQLPQAKGEA